MFKLFLEEEGFDNTFMKIRQLAGMQSDQRSQGQGGGRYTKEVSIW